MKPIWTQQSTKTNCPPLSVAKLANPNLSRSPLERIWYKRYHLNPLILMRHLEHTATLDGIQFLWKRESSSFQGEAEAMEVLHKLNPKLWGTNANKSVWMCLTYIDILSGPYRIQKFTLSSHPGNGILPKFSFPILIKKTPHRGTPSVYGGA